MNQEYVVFLRAKAGKIAFLREYFGPTRAAVPVRVLFEANGHSFGHSQRVGQ
jgi:hypothetical protein